MTDLYYAAACQTDFPAAQSRDEISDRVDRMLAIIEQTITGYEPFFDVRLLVFPEFAHTVPTYTTVDELIEKLAVRLPNEHTQRYEQIAAQYGCYIQTGSFLEIDDAYPGHVFNTTLLIGPDGILSKYRKVNPWIPWEVHSSPHDIDGYNEDPFPVADTELGKLGVATCYDWLFPETIREYAFRGVEVMIRISAYMDPWGATEPMDWWNLVNRTRALENMMYVVAANQGASMEHYPPFSWPGGSMVVDYDGRVLAQADPGPGEKVVVAPISPSTLRAERERRVGHDTVAHTRTGLYTYLDQERLRPATQKISIENLNDRISQAKPESRD
ncbi:MAG: nitrilase [Gammaproteobacteria bacterium]|nr:nitrilase [Gammaproteobacteria bacterium]RPG25695.1 MAG: nitrilase [Gammaproteobacteria bacterium TMED50]